MYLYLHLYIGLRVGVNPLYVSLYIYMYIGLRVNPNPNPFKGALCA